MAKLSTAERNALPDSAFALPGRRFPIQDKAHQVAAERLIGRAKAAGSVSSKEVATVKSKAASALHKKAQQYGSK